MFHKKYEQKIMDCLCIIDSLCMFLNPNTDSEFEVLNRNNHGNITRLVQAYKLHGHKKADLDPLGLRNIM